MKSESLQQRSQGLRFPALRIFLRFFLIILIGLIHNPHFVFGWSCYNCTSQDKGCNNKLGPSSTEFIKECDVAAIGCLVYAYEYDYIDGVIFHRDCVYPGDPGIQLGEFDSRGEFYYDSEKYNYYDTVLLWNSYRESGRHPEINKVKHPLQNENGKFRVLMYDESHKELSNSVALSEWKKTWPDRKSLSPTRQKSIQCYSCEATEQGDSNVYIEMKEVKSDWRKSLLPECGEMKTITCKNAYGCATRYEKTDVQDPNQPSGYKKFNKAVAWRGCWYPGDLKCLRSAYDNSGRSLSLNKSRQGMDEEGSECRKAYQRSYEDGKGEVVWSGKKPFSTNRQFSDYQSCRYWSRRFAGLDEPSPDYVPNWPEVTNGFAVVQYRFCGPKPKCNRDDKTPEEKEEEKKGEEEKETNECKEAPEGDDFESGPELESCNCTVIHEKGGAVYSKRDGDMKIIALALLTEFAGVFWTSRIYSF